MEIIINSIFSLSTFEKKFSALNMNIVDNLNPPFSTLQLYFFALFLEKEFQDFF